MMALVGIALAILVVLALAARLLGKCFRDRTIRKRIMVWTIAVYCAVCAAYFSFIAFVLSGSLNR